MKKLISEYNGQLLTLPYNNDNGTKRYLESIHAWFKKEDECKNIPMNSMLGCFEPKGVAKFNPGVWDQVLRHIAEDIDNDNMIFFNEKASGPLPYRFAYEIDLLSDKVIPDGVLLNKVIWKCHNIITTYCPEAPCDFVVLSRPPKPKMKKDTKKNEVWYVSQGLHVIYPNLFITTKMGRQIVHHMESIMDAQGKPFVGIVDTIFNSVADGARLRMPYSFKTPFDCPVCKNLPSIRQECESCERRGTVICPYYYRPWKRFNRIQEEIEFPVSKYDILKLCTINAPTHSLPRYVIPPLAPIKPDVLRSKRKRKVDYPNETSFKGTELKQPTDVLKEAIVEFRPDMKNIVIDKVTKQQKWKKVIVNVRGEGQHNCKIKGSPHGSNRIYFEFDFEKYVILQRCFNEDCKKQWSEHWKECYNNYEIRNNFTYSPRLGAIGFKKPGTFLRVNPKKQTSSISDKRLERANMLKAAAAKYAPEEKSST